MSIENLDNLVKTGNMQTEKISQPEFDGLYQSAVAQLGDSKNTGLTLESRFALAYGASHSIALAALRYREYRCSSRQLVFQCLRFTLDLPPEQTRIFVSAHRVRNLAAYEGHMEVNLQLVESLIRVTESALHILTDLVDHHS